MNRNNVRQPIPVRKSPLAQAIGTILFLQALGATPLLASPTGGEVVGGSGTIQYQDSNTTVIQQQSGTMVIDWNSFNLNNTDLVVFQQPSTSAAALNRIYDQNPSQIFGTIQANGQLFLMNPNGIIFGEGSRIEVNGLVATTLMMDRDEFMQRLYRMHALDGNGGVIVNRGMISAATGGVTLVGSGVSNEGVVMANGGSINLASGTSATVDFDGDHLINFAVSGEVLQNSASLDASVSNSGTLSAEGGTVLLSAQAARSVFDNAINNTGVIKATRVVDSGGVIRLEGPNGSINNSGVLDVSATSAGQDAGEVDISALIITNSGQIDASAADGDGGTIVLAATDTTELNGSGSLSATSQAEGVGGTIVLLGDRVGLLDQTSVDASGALSGGEIRVGGDFHGTTDLQASSLTYIGSDASLRADALQQGDGGNIAVWSDGTTIDHGQISAQGGSEGGNGGFVEVSGKESLVFDGSVDTSAVVGQYGTLLLDPTDIYVVAHTSSPDTADLTKVDQFADANLGTASTSIDVDSINGASADVVLQATNNIEFQAAVNITTAGVGLTAQADNNITLDPSATITTNSGAVTLQADYDASNGGNVTLNAGIVTKGGALTLSGANVTSGAAGTINTSGINGSTNGTDGTAAGSVTITASSSDVNVAVITANGGDGNWNGGSFANGGDGGSVSITAGSGNIYVASISSTGGAGGGTNGGTGTPGRAGDVTLSLGTTNTAQQTLTLTGTITGGTLSFSGNNDTLILPDINNTVTINSTNGGTITNSSFTTTNSSGGADFSGFANLTGGSGNDTFNFNNSGSLTGLIDGGTGTDAVDYSAVSGAVTVTRGTSITNIETATGNSNSTLVGLDANSTFSISGTDSGSVGSLNFSSFKNLTGGSGSDTFAFSGSGNLTGTIYGGGGSDTLDYSSVSGAETVNLATNAASLTGGISSIEAMVAAGGNDTLVLPNSANTVTISGTDSGTANSGSFTFTNVANLTGGSGDDTFTFGLGGSLSGLIDGGAGTDSASYTGVGSAVVVTLGQSITNIESVTGFAGSTLVGDNSGNTFTISGTDSGSVGSLTFSGFQSLTGGSGDDTFTFSGGSISGTIDAGTGNDTLDYSGVTGAETVNLAANTASLTGGISSIESMVGAGGDDTLVLANSTNSVTIDGSDSGTVNSGTFTDVAYLIGGSGDDSFTFNGGSISGTIDGGGGSDTLDYSGVTGAETVNLANNSASLVFGNAANGISNFEGMVGVGGDDTLVLANTTNTVIINGANAGTSTYGINTFSFTDVANLTGGSSADTFNFIGGSLSGLIDGGAGTDSVSYAGVSGAITVTLGISITNVESVTGNPDSGTTLVGTDSGNTFTISGTNSGSIGTVNFFSFKNLTGGSGDDTFIFGASGSLDGAIDGGGQATTAGDTVNYSAVISPVTVTLGGLVGLSNIETIIGNASATQTATLTGYDATSNDFVINGTAGSGSVDSGTNHINFSGFNSLNGGSQDDTFSLAGSFSNLTIDGQGGTDSLALSGNVSITGTAALAAENISDTGGYQLSASSLQIDSALSVGSSTNPLNIAVTNLSIANSGSGDFYLNQSGALSLGDLTVSSFDLSTSGALTVVGSISASSGNIALRSGGALTFYKYDATNESYTSGSLSAGSAGNILFASDDIGLYATTIMSTGTATTSSSIDAGGGTVTLTSYNPGTHINVGGTGVGLGDISTAEINVINNYGKLVFGDTNNTGGISLSAALSLTDMSLVTSGAVSGNGYTLTANNIDLTAGTGIGSSISPLLVDTPSLSASNSTSGGIYIQNANSSGTTALNGLINNASGGVVSYAGTGVLDLNSNVVANTGTIALNTTGDITSNPGSLSASSIHLTTSGGAINANVTGGTLYASAPGDITGSSSGGLGIGGVITTGNSSAISLTAAGSIYQSGNIAAVTGNIDVTSGGTITMASGSSTTTKGGTISYQGGGDIILNQLDAANGVVANVGTINIDTSPGSLYSVAVNVPSVRANDVNINVNNAIGHDPVNTFNLSSDIAGTVTLRYAGVAYISTAPVFNVDLNIVDAGGNMVNSNAARSAAAQRGQATGLEEIGYIDAALFGDISLFGIKGPGIALPADQSEEAPLSSMQNGSKVSSN